MEMCSIDESHLSCVVKQERAEDFSIDIVFLTWTYDVSPEAENSQLCSLTNTHCAVLGFTFVQKCKVHQQTTVTQSSTFSYEK